MRRPSDGPMLSLFVSLVWLHVLPLESQSCTNDCLCSRARAQVALPGIQVSRKTTTSTDVVSSRPQRFGHVRGSVHVVSLRYAGTV